jgi:hypothetical protein
VYDACFAGAARKTRIIHTLFGLLAGRIEKKGDFEKALR